MAFRRFDSIVNECVGQMRAGATVDQCLARYPRQAERLSPLLALADKVARTPLVSARTQAREQAWTRLSQRTLELRQGKRPAPVPTVRIHYGAWLKPAAIAASFVLAVSIASGGVVYAAQDALPDSPLYRVKLASEDARLWFVFDDEREAEILLDQSDERIDEITRMVARGDPVPEAALSALYDRNQRAVEILQDHTDNTELRARVLNQAQSQEELLLALWPEVPEGARSKYAETVAHLHNTRLGGGAGNAFVSVQPEELSGGILSIAGQAEMVEEGVWQIGGVEVRIDERTLGRRGIVSGGSASVLVARSSNGRLHALSLSSLQTGPVSSGIVSGAVEEVTKDGINIAGQWIAFSDQTVQLISAKPGERVQVTLTNNENGIVAGTVGTIAVTAQTLWFEGTIQGDVSNATSLWHVSGFDFQITPSTAFDARGGPAADGARVQVEAVEVDGDLLARRVTVLNSNDSADTVSILGTFNGFDATEAVWRISGIAVVPPDVGEDPPEGALVVVDARRIGGDLHSTGLTVIEQPGQPSLVQLQGTIGQIDGSRWTLEIGQVRVASTADVSGRPDVGVRVFVWGERGVDGTLQATYARVLDDAPITAPPEEAADGE